MKALRKSFRPTPELNKESRVITCVITDASNRAQQAANLIRSEAVAKFSSFRQLRVSTINNFLAVMGVTLLRDASQYTFAVHYLY
jgi:hypothetical protein